MKRIFIMLIVAMLSFSVDAQDSYPKNAYDSINEIIKTDVTTFLGIPVDGTKTEMKQKLIAKGFVPKKIGDIERLEGEFNGHDVYLAFKANKGKVWRVGVINKTPYSEAQIRLQFNALVRQFKNSSKYVYTEQSAPTIDKSEDINYEMSIRNKVYEAQFSQKSHVEGDLKKKIEQLKLSWLKEFFFADEETKHYINGIIENSISIAQLNKSVWLKIFRDSYDIYHIVIFYDNEYNRPNGEDL